MKRVLALTLALSLSGGGFLAGRGSAPSTGLSAPLTACYEAGLDEGNRMWAEEVTEWEPEGIPVDCQGGQS